MAAVVETRTGVLERGDGVTPLGALRTELMPQCIDLLQNGDMNERASACVAIGRLGGRTAIPLLRSAFHDAAPHVRERAILSLGATGADSAIPLLMHIAQEGTCPGCAALGGQHEIAPDAPALAVLALAIGRKNGMGPEADVVASAVAQTVDPRDSDALVEALALYQSVSPCQDLERFCFAVSEDRRSDGEAKCRSLESLRRSDGAAVVALLGKYSVGSNLELRRSSALSLGELVHPDASARLRKACDKEREPLAQAFQLVSIGRQGGVVGREYLEDYLDRGRKSRRLWAALGLGILAREHDDAAARERLVEGAKHEKNRGSKGAWYIAIGIAQAEEGLPMLEEALLGGDNPLNRQMAAEALALIGTERARSVLLRALGEEKQLETRAAIARSVGYLGDPRDGLRLVELVRKATRTQERALLTSALELHGSRTALDGLLEAFKQAEASVERAGAMQSLQVVLGSVNSHTWTDLLRQSNYSNLPSVMLRHFYLPM